jgi:hypothetical protein
MIYEGCFKAGAFGFKTTLLLSFRKDLAVWVCGLILIPEIKKGLVI